MAMNFSAFCRLTIFLVLAASSAFRRTLAEDYYNDDGGNADEAAVDGYYNDYSNPYENNNGGYQEQGDAIKYWTEYAILPKRCIV